MKKPFRLATTAKLTIVILISRLSGYVRDMFVASLVGAGPVGDALMAAFKITNLFRSIFGEGAMSSAVVPAISKALITHGNTYTKVVTSHVFSFLVLALICFTSIIMYFMREFIEITNPGFGSKPDVLDLAVELSYITFPYLIFISSAAFYGAVLQSRRIFLPYASTSIILNLTIIAALTFGIDFTGGSAVHAFAYGLMTSGVIELSWMIFFARKYDAKIIIRKPMKSLYIARILKRIVPGIFGSGLTQISTWCDMIILSFFSGGISCLYFADRIIQLPLALFGTANAIVLLPSLSKNYDNQQARSNSFNKSFRKTLCLTIPSAVGIFMIGDTIVKTLFMHGQFSEESANDTTVILKLLAIALPFQAMAKIYNTVLYAAGNTSTPVKFSAVSLVVNITFSFLLMDRTGYRCVAIATIISSATQLCLLVYYCMKTKCDGVVSSESQKDVYKYLLGVLVMSISILTVRIYITLTSNLLMMLAYVTVGVVIYGTILVVTNARVKRDFLVQRKIVS